MTKQLQLRNLHIISIHVINQMQWTKEYCRSAYVEIMCNDLYTYTADVNICISVSSHSGWLNLHDYSTQWLMCMYCTEIPFFAQRWEWLKTGFCLPVHKRMAKFSVSTCCILFMFEISIWFTYHSQIGWWSLDEWNTQPFNSCVFSKNLQRIIFALHCRICSHEQPSWAIYIIYTYMKLWI